MGNSKTDSNWVNAPSHGLVWYNNIYDFGLIAVPKCMSSGLRQQFSLEFTKPVNEVTAKKLISIVRCPVDRYVSAYIEVMIPSVVNPQGRYRMTPSPTDLLPKLDNVFKLSDDDFDKFKRFTDYIFTYGYFDPHIVQQVDYLRHLNTKKYFKNVNIFKIEYCSGLEKFLGHKLEKRNVCDHPQLKNSLLQFITNNKEYKEKVEKLYKEDLDFYKSFNKQLIT